MKRKSLKKHDTNASIILDLDCIHDPHQLHSPMLFARVRGYNSMPVLDNGTNVSPPHVLATQAASLFSEEGCKGNYTTFDSSSNSFLVGFDKYVKNLKSVALRGLLLLLQS